MASIRVRYSRSVTGTPAALSSWKKVTNMAPRPYRSRRPDRQNDAAPPPSHRSLRPSGARQSSGARTAVNALAAIVILLAPALWNGFPLLEHDTGGYLARWFEGTLEVSRSTVYGLYLVVLAFPDFWPAVVVQAALTLWIIALLLRVHGWGRGPGLLLLTVAVISVLTALPWLASMLLTDIFAGLGVIALYLVVLRGDALHRWERGRSSWWSPSRPPATARRSRSCWRS